MPNSELRKVKRFEKCLGRCPLPCLEITKSPEASAAYAADEFNLAADPLRDCQNSRNDQKTQALTSIIAKTPLIDALFG